MPLVGPSGAELEADLAFHPGEREAMSALHQSYALGDVVAARKAFVARQPMGRFGTAEEIAALKVRS